MLVPGLWAPGLCPGPYSLLCDAAHMSAVWHSRHVCCVTQQKCLMFHSADMSTVWHSSCVFCVTQQTRLLRATADMSAV